MRIHTGFSAADQVANERITGSKVRIGKRISVKAEDCGVKTEAWSIGVPLQLGTSVFILFQYPSAVNFNTSQPIVQL